VNFLQKLRLLKRILLTLANELSEIAVFLAFILVFAIVIRSKLERGLVGRIFGATIIDLIFVFIDCVHDHLVETWFYHVEETIRLL